MPKTPEDPRSESLAELGRRIKTRRDELGISQERLALRVGLHWTMIGQVERGKRNVSMLNLLSFPLCGSFCRARWRALWLW